MALSLRIILGMLIFVTTIVVALIAFLPTYFAGVKAVDSTISDIRRSYVERCESSVDVFLELPLTRLRQAALLFSSGIQNNTYDNEPQYEKWVIDMGWKEREIFSTTSFSLRSDVRASGYPMWIYADHNLNPTGPIVGTDRNHTGLSADPRNHRNVSLDIRAVNPTTLERENHFINQVAEGKWKNRSDDEITDILAVPDLAAMSSPRTGFVGIWPVFEAALLISVCELYDSQRDEVIGVLSINTKIVRLQALMQNLGLRERSRGVAFLIHPQAMVLGLSWDEDPQIVQGNAFTVGNANSAVKFKWFTNITGGDFLRTEVVPTLGLPFLTDQSYSSYTNTINTKEHGLTYVDIVTVRKTNLVVRCLLAMPESDFMDGISKARSAALGGTISAIVVTLGVAFVFASIITAPLVRLQERMSLAARFEDTEADDPRSMMSEVAGMQESYQKMRNELNRAKPYLPQSILDNQEDDQDEGDLESKIMSSKGGNSDAHHRSSIATYSVDDRSARSRNMTTDSGSMVSRRSRQSYTQSIRGTAIPATVGLNISTAVTNKRVSVVVFNLREFSFKRSPGDLAEMQKKQLACVSKHVREYKGNVDFFQGDFIQCSFNAVKGCAAHLRCSLQATLAVLGDMAGQAMMPVCTAGMSSGIASVGNMGTEEMRRFCIVGHVVQQAILLERLNKTYGTKLLAPEQSIVEVASEYLLRGVDLVQLPRGPTKSAAPLLMVEVLGRANSGEMDEWMYELERGAQDNPFHGVNAAFRHLLDGEQKLAAEELAKVEARSANATPQPEGTDGVLSSSTKKRIDQRAQQHQEQVKDSKRRA